MSADKFKALIAEGNSSAYKVAFKELTNDELPKEDVLIEVQYSSVNYKDGLAVTGRGKIIRKFPMVLGIDMAGRVLESNSPEFRPGDQVLAVGNGFSETRWGGYSQRQRVPAVALVHIPKGLTLKQTMAIGSAGFTSMLCLIALEHYGVKPGEKEIIITGAGGGVGSTAVALFAAKGYKVAASTGRPELHAFLRELGATTIVDRAELAQKTAPLLGINSVPPPRPLSIQAWERLARELPLDKLDSLTTTEPLSAIFDLADKILAGKTRGRVVIDVSAQ